jgi:hypothetical protein
VTGGADGVRDEQLHRKKGHNRLSRFRRGTSNSKRRMIKLRWGEAVCVAEHGSCDQACWAAVARRATRARASERGDSDVDAFSDKHAVTCDAI